MVPTTIPTHLPAADITRVWITTPPPCSTSRQPIIFSESGAIRQSGPKLCGALPMRDSLNRLSLTTAALFIAALFSCLASGALAADICPRPVQGSEITSPPDLYSQNGVLSVTLD